MSKYKRAKSDMLIGALTLLFSIGYFAATYTFRLLEHANTVNAAFFPRILAVMAAALGLYIFFQGFLAYRKLTAEERMVPQEKKKRNHAGMLRITAVFLVLLVAAITFRKVGFILTLPWMMFCLFVILERREKRRYLLYLLLSIVLPIAVFFIFYYVFQTLLPMGVLRTFLSMYFL